MLKDKSLFNVVHYNVYQPMAGKCTLEGPLVVVCDKSLLNLSTVCCVLCCVYLLKLFNNCWKIQTCLRRHRFKC